MKDIMLYYLKNLISSPSGFTQSFPLWNIVIRPEFKNIFDDDLNKVYINTIIKTKTNKNIYVWLDCFETLRSSRLKFSILKAAINRVGFPERIDGHPLISRADDIANCFGLTGPEREVLRLITLASKYRWVKDLLYDTICDSNMLQPFKGSTSQLIGYLIKVPRRQVEKAFGPEGGLSKNGLIDFDDDGEVSPSSPLKKMIFASTEGKDFSSVILSKISDGSLNGVDFDFIGENFGHLVSLLKKSLVKKAKGINVLLYGCPGIGKTELAKTLCREIGADLYSCSDMSDWGSVFNWDKEKLRLSETLTALALLRNYHNSVLIFDEAEDVFNKGSLKRISKLFINRLLEDNATPIIWTTNSIREMEPAHLRRFSFALEMRTPPFANRLRIWDTELKKNGIEMPAERIEEIARDYELPPSFASSSIRSAVLAGDHGAVVKILNNLERAVTGLPRPMRPAKAKKGFDAGLLRADLDLGKLSGRLEGLKIKNFSLCIYGPPGTGKSEYAKRLADILGMTVLRKKASDLKSMWVGETESNISQAFREAAYGNYFLIFDEADSFLRDRTYAHRSWEVTEVNEMLTQMENHPLPFVCTTNLFESLDKASLRRFTFKVRLDYLDKARAIRAFSHFFGFEHDPGLKYLTPGDFALVAKKADILGITSPAGISELLSKETAFKGELGKKIGY